MSITKWNKHVLLGTICLYLSLRSFDNYLKLIDWAAVRLVQANGSITSTTYSGAIAADSAPRSFDIKESDFSFQVLIYSLATVFLIVYDW